MITQDKNTSDMSIYLRYLHHEGGIPCSELVKRYPQYAPRSIYRHAKKRVAEAVFDKRSLNKGRPGKLTLRDERSIIRAVKEEFWTEGISFYFDGIGFVHKTSPNNEARSSGAISMCTI